MSGAISEAVVLRAIGRDSVPRKSDEPNSSTQQLTSTYLTPVFYSTLLLNSCAYSTPQLNYPNLLLYTLLCAFLCVSLLPDPQLYFTLLYYSSIQQRSRFSCLHDSVVLDPSTCSPPLSYAAIYCPSGNLEKFAH